MHYRSVTSFCTAAVLMASSGLASSAGLADQWYVGIGGGASLLKPDPVLSSLRVDDDEGQTGTLFFGRDLDANLSAQLQLSSFGEAEINNNSTVPYVGAEASMLYRFVDSRVLLSSSGYFGASLYGRIGLGYIDRDTALELRRGTPGGVAAGAGVELYLSRYFALRAEAVYNAEDLTSATLSVVGRFGTGSGLQELPSASSGSRGNAPAEPEVPEVPATDTNADAVADAETDAATDADASTVTDAETDAATDADASTVTDAATDVTTDADVLTDAATDTDSVTDAVTDEAGDVGETLGDAAVTKPELNTSVPAIPSGVPSTDDRDGDGVPNTDDVCLRSATGFPVRANGCPVFDGVLSGVRFADGSSELLSESFTQLDFLIDLLKRYPQSRIELLSHTDDRGTVREQSIVTRARLRSVGTYLVQNGIRSNRLVLRSFGGTRPLFDNSTPEGKARNNRIEVLEKTE